MAVLRSLLIGALVAGFAGADFKSACLAFNAQQYISNSTLWIRTFIPGNTTISNSDNVATCGRPTQLVSVDLCRIVLSVPTSKQSSFNFELWMPREWGSQGQRIVATGNGGIDGCVRYEDLGFLTQYGFAAVGTNNGHNGTTAVTMMNNNEVIKDFADRALGQSIIQGKKIIAHFYGASHKKAYYYGCSLGGRQGITMADKYPGEFDGIYAGSPAVDFNNMNSWRATFATITGQPGDATFIDGDTWKNLIHNEVLKQCDGLDGVLDGVIEDPDVCHFDPTTIQCGSSAVQPCLTAAQVDTVNKIFSPFTDEDGNVIFPAMQPGSEVGAVSTLYGGTIFPYSSDWFKYVVYQDPTWTGIPFTAADAALADALNPADIRTYPKSLRNQYNSGGKVIVTHGMQDEKITSFNSERFYNNLLAGMHRTPAELEEFYRFFRITGMGHCANGPGAWVVGTQGGPLATAIGGLDPEKSVLGALVNWVENGVAPDTLEGTKFVNDDPAQGIAFTRKHCRYPLRNTFIGGDASNPDSWECKQVS
ncbi:Tannase/feruloyl esterase [Xylogone sp. PMI_703]|nr:Tannase/feruloyl esterase [Xylogone sp. PMI_703]